MSVMADPRDRTREFLSAITALKRGVQNSHKPPVSTPGDAQVGSGAMYICLCFPHLDDPFPVNVPVRRRRIYGI
eukprot:1392408-Amorphochlora_amoeboformis.AAC.1